MRSFASPSDLAGGVREALVNLLYRLADDELVIGHRDSDWTAHTPINEANVAFSAMARDELGHARVYYQMLHDLGEGDPHTLAFGRESRDFRCAALTGLPKGDWGFSVVRRFLYDAGENVRLAALAESSFIPVARLATKLRGDEKNHLAQGRKWVLQLSGACQENRRIMQTALDAAYPHALGLFEPTEYDEPLAQSGICPREDELQRQWESAVAPVLADAGLSVPEAAPPIYGGRVGRHPAALKELIEGLRSAHNSGRTA